MSTQDPLEYDDLGDALREGRALRSARGYRILFAQGDLNFISLTVTDPVPLGRQILEAAGLEPRDSFSLFGILPSGEFEDVRLDEPFDLRERGAERFVAFRTDRDFKLTLDDRQLAWGKPVISGAVLYGLATPGENEAVFLEVRGGEDRLIEPGDLIDLDGPGIERFITAPNGPPTYEIIINSRPRTVNDRRVTFEQVVQFAFPGQHEPNVEFSMTYRHAASKPPSGELGAGGSVEVKKKGTIFNVTRTVQS
ncbi:multiubiquitin domain-containing protein [Arenibaculum pallidiluteum]|uniref:multiubiquitin domain-containing protein n=1 Tax=Arenibaculum pallidiluteum TaxID=2812559 RepID=UPI001A9666E8|nr:multiubiquitin domain-containing protein [Arenibaculum pallidiluteum]